MENPMQKSIFVSIPKVETAKMHIEDTVKKFIKFDKNEKLDNLNLWDTIIVMDRMV